MTFYTTIYGEHIPLDELDKGLQENIWELRKEVLKNIRAFTRTKLNRYSDFFFEDVNRFIGYLPRPVEQSIDDTLSKIAIDLRSRIRIVAGLKSNTGCVDPGIHSKPWTHNKEHSIYVIQVTKESDDKAPDAPLDFFISRVQLYDEPQTIPQEGLHEAHEVRGRDMIASFDVFSKEKDVEDITAIRTRFSAKADSLFLDVFRHGFVHGINCAAKELPASDFDLDDVTEHHPVIDTIYSHLQIDVRRHLQNLSRDSTLHGLNGRKRGHV